MLSLTPSGFTQLIFMECILRSEKTGGGAGQLVLNAKGQTWGMWMF